MEAGIESRFQKLKANDEELNRIFIAPLHYGAGVKENYARFRDVPGKIK